MNVLIENNYITEMECGANFAYILNDDNIFLPTEYKVLQSQDDSCFVKCMKMLYNGKMQLYYLTKSLKQFASMISYLDVGSFLIIVENLFDDIISVKNNGFLSCQNIDISFERIYVDPFTHKARLVYLPLNKRIYEDDESFEYEIRTALIKLIASTPSLSSPETMRLSRVLSDGKLTMKDLHNRVRENKLAGPAKSVMHVISMNAPVRIDIQVTKDEFILGRKPGLADGVIAFNKMIGRSHCKISKSGAGYTVTDLNSANGTFVNGLRLQRDRSYPIKNGDIIRLANSDFQIRIR